MGKISDALERHKKEKPLEAEALRPDKPVSRVDEVSESPFVNKSSDRFGFSPKLVVLSEPDSVNAEHFKLLRGQILFARDRERPRTIMVTSAFPGEGKTFVSANLAASIALGIDEYVLVIDADLRRPYLHEMFGYPNTEGLHEYLIGKKELPDLITKTGIDKMSLLLAGSAPSNPTELLSSNRMEDFIKEVKGRYQDRFIIIDSTPSHVTAEANILANYVDGIVLVVMAQKSPRKAIQTAIENLGREKILGIVFNGYTKADKNYYKYYKKYYKGKS